MFRYEAGPVCHGSRFEAFASAPSTAPLLFPFPTPPVGVLQGLPEARPVSVSATTSG